MFYVKQEIQANIFFNLQIHYWKYNMILLYG